MTHTKTDNAQNAPMSEGATPLTDAFFRALEGDGLTIWQALERFPVFARKLERDRADAVEALRKIDDIAKSFPTAGVTCGEVARSILCRLDSKERT